VLLFDAITLMTFPSISILVGVVLLILSPRPNCPLSLCPKV
jgi:hypothetical protein